MFIATPDVVNVFVVRLLLEIVPVAVILRTLTMLL